MESEKKSGKFKSFLVKVKEKILDLIFPPNIKCICCGSDVPDFENTPFCEDCLKKLEFNNKKRCKICDAPIKSEGDTCDACIAYHKDFSRAFAPFVYEPTIRRPILRLKNDNGRFLAPTFAKLIANRLKDENISIDFIVPVPASKKTMRTRGFNQAELIAKELALILNVPLKTDLFEKKDDKIAQQKFSNYRQRFDNAHKAYIVNNIDYFKGKNVLIVDDVMTTGATLHALSHLIKKKANNIYCAVFARQILRENDDSSSKLSKKSSKSTNSHDKNAKNT